MNSVFTKKILLTGVAGFIGHHLAIKYLEEGYQVLGIDNLRNDDSYDFKSQRLNNLQSKNNFTFEHIDIRDKEVVDRKSVV